MNDDELLAALDSGGVRLCALRMEAMLRRAGVPVTADDLMQSAYIKIRTRRPGGREVERPRGLLCTTIERLALDQLRQQRRPTPVSADVVELLTARHDPGYAEVDRRLRSEAVERFVLQRGDELWHAAEAVLGPRESGDVVRRAAVRAAMELIQADADPDRRLNELFDEALDLLTPHPGTRPNSRARSLARTRPWLSYLVWRALLHTEDTEGDDLLLVAVTRGHHSDAQRRANEVTNPALLAALQAHVAGLEAWLDGHRR